MTVLIAMLAGCAQHVERFDDAQMVCLGEVPPNGRFDEPEPVELVVGEPVSVWALDSAPLDATGVDFGCRVDSETPILTVATWVTYNDPPGVEKGTSQLVSQCQADELDEGTYLLVFAEHELSIDVPNSLQPTCLIGYDDG